MHLKRKIKNALKKENQERGKTNFSSNLFIAPPLHLSTSRLSPSLLPASGNESPNEIALHT
jgi:hypothetical protein